MRYLIIQDAEKIPQKAVKKEIIRELAESYRDKYARLRHRATASQNAFADERDVFEGRSVKFGPAVAPQERAQARRFNASRLSLFFHVFQPELEDLLHVVVCQGVVRVLPHAADPHQVALSQYLELVRNRGG